MSRVPQTSSPSFVSQEWSVHAQLTISHRRPPDAASFHGGSTVRDDSGVQMQYSWSTVPPAETVAAAAAATPRPCYGFQRGNITFTTTRPPATSVATPPGQGMLDSGYASGRVSPGLFYGSLPSRKATQQPYNRRCRSTCSITLAEVCDEEVNSSAGGHASVNRSHSLKERCDPGPVQQQQHQACDVNRSHSLKARHDPGGRPGGGGGVCEVCGGDRSPSAMRRAANYTTHFCTLVPDKAKQQQHSQDAASQTTNVATPPVEQQQQQQVCGRGRTAQTAARNRASYSARRKTDSTLLQVPALDLPSDAADAAADAKPGKPRLSRSPARLHGKSPLLRKSSSRSPETVRRRPTPPQQQGQQKTHKPRTVHIDVYCTGSDASDDDDDDDTATSDSSAVDSDDVGDEETVFESDQVRVVHTRPGPHSLPHALRGGKTHTPPPPYRHHKPRDPPTVVAADLGDRGRCESLKYTTTTAGAASLRHERTPSRGYDSDDGLSSHYPSRLSSYTSRRESSVTSVAPSSSAMSYTSCAFTDDDDFTVATSCKDTATDLSVVAASAVSLAPSDSFEYADSLDRERIRERERAWGTRDEGEESRSWRSPQTVRKHMLQQQKMREFLAKHLGTAAFPLWKTEKRTDDSDDEDDDDETGDAWSFGAESLSMVNSLKREDTVRRATPTLPTTAAAAPIADIQTVVDQPDVIKAHLTLTPAITRIPRSAGDVIVSRKAAAPQHPLFGCRRRSPSPTPDKIVSGVASPFTSRVGVRTDQLSRAEKFGTIVGAFRKPGHHVGPSKNPECGCAHCRNYYDQLVCRSRTRSLDMSADAADNWKAQLQEQIAKRINGGNDPRGGKTAPAQVDDAAESAVCQDDEWEDSTAV